MTIDEHLIEQIAKAVKENGDLSVWKKNRQLAPLVNLLQHLNAVPKKHISHFDFTRVRNQILNRIATPKVEKVGAKWPKVWSLGIGAIGSLLIVISLTMGTAVAALQAGPDQKIIYPLKKIVENIQFQFTPDDEKAALQLRFAENRAEEIQAVLDKQESGQISTEQAQQIVSATVQDLQKTAAAAARRTVKQPKASVVNKLADLTSRLKAASIHTDGEVKIEIEKAVESTKVSQEEAIKNIENAGIKVEDKPLIVDNGVTASGKLTAVTDTSVSIGTAKFLLTKETVFTGLTAKDLTVGQVVDITGKIKDNKTYADKINLISDVKPQESTETPLPVETP